MSDVMEESGENGVTIHGNTRHTDRTRQLWIPAHPYNTGTQLRDVDLYDSGTNYYGYYSVAIPHNYAGGNISVKIYMSGTDGGSGNIMLDVDMRIIADGEAMNTGAYEMKDEDVFALTDNLKIYDAGSTSGTLNIGEMIRFVVGRKSTDVLDTYDSDMAIYGVLLEYTADQ